MASSTELQVVITAKDEASAKLSGLKGAIDSNKESLLAMGAIAATAFAGIVSFASKAIDSANESAKVQAQLNAVLTSTHQAAGLYIDDLNDQAKALQSMTTYSDEAVGGVQALLLTFTSISGPVVQQATGTILDMSTALHEDLQSASIQVGKALQDPINGITALRRVGVNFSDDQKAVIKQLVDTGQTAKAQQLILAELAKEFGGSAAAAAGTFAGKQEQLKNQIDDVQESIGNALIPVLQQLLTAVVPVITKIGEWIQQHPQITKWIIILAAGITGLITGLTLLAGAVLLVNLAMSPITLIILAVVAAIALLVAGAILIITHWTQIKDFFAALWGDIKKIFSEAIAAIVDYFKPLTDVIQGVANTIGKVASGISSVAKGVGGAVSSTVKAIIPHATGGSVSPYSTYLVGENGPELFSSSTRGSITPNSGIGGGGNNFTINVNGGYYLDERAARDFGNMLAKTIGQQVKLRSI